MLLQAGVLGSQPSVPVIALTGDAEEWAFPNAVLFEEFLLEAREGHRSILSCCQDYQTF